MLKRSAPQLDSCNCDDVLDPLTLVTCMFCLFACGGVFYFLVGWFVRVDRSSQMVLGKNIRRFAEKPQPKPIIKIVIPTTKKSETKLTDRGLKQDQNTHGVKKDAYFNQTIQNMGIFFLQLTFLQWRMDFHWKWMI